MDDFEDVFETGGIFSDYLRCKHCGERVERGIENVSHHWLHCLKRTDGLIIATSDFERKIADSWSINLKTKR